MPIRLRKFVGAILLILLVVTWALLAMAFAQSPLVKANGVIEVIYYVVAGLGWVLPAMTPSTIRIAASTQAINRKSRRAKTILWRMRSSSNTDGLPTISLSDSRSVHTAIPTTATHAMIVNMMSALTFASA